MGKTAGPTVPHPLQESLQPPRESRSKATPVLQTRPTDTSSNRNRDRPLHDGWESSQLSCFGGPSPALPR